MSGFAPVALFAWRRPEHLRKVLDALEANPEAGETDVFAYCDAPRTPSQAAEVEAVVRVLEAACGFRSLSVVRRETNFGLARNIVSGVTETVNKYGRIVVLEDDLVVSRSFLGWMNEGLRRYEDVVRVASIHGYVYPVRGVLPGSFFLRGADCWGWATWKRAWDAFEPDGTILEARLLDRKLAHRFDWNGAFGYMDMLRGQIEGRNDSWAVRWHASAFLAGMLTLYPGRALVANIGHDDSGTHSGGSREYDVEPAEAPPRSWPDRIEESREAWRPIREFLWKASGRRRSQLDRILSLAGLR